MKDIVGRYQTNAVAASSGALVGILTDCPPSWRRNASWGSRTRPRSKAKAEWGEAFNQAYRESVLKYTKSGKGRDSPGQWVNFE